MSDENVLHTTVGRVVSNANDKTITVVVERQVKHPLYGKYIRRRTKLRAHDEDNTARVGDLVRISPARPTSKTKAWRLVDVVAAASEGEPA